MRYMEFRSVLIVLTTIGLCIVVVALADDDEDSFTSRLNETLFSHYNSNSNNNNNEILGNNNNKAMVYFPRYDNRPARPRGSNGEGMPGNSASAVLWARQRSRDSCVRKIKILNGVAVFRRRASIVKFICSQGFSLLGATIAVCLSSRWSEPPPICVKSGCTSVRQPLNGEAMFHMDGAVVSFQCKWNYELVGNAVLYCNGIRWNGTEPTCNPLYEESIMTTTTHNANADWDYVTESSHVQVTADSESLGIAKTSTDGGREEAWDENVEVTTASTKLGVVVSSPTQKPKLPSSETSTLESVMESINPSTTATTSTVAQTVWDDSFPFSEIMQESTTEIVSTSTELPKPDENATTSIPIVKVTSDEPTPTTIGLSTEISLKVDSTTAMITEEVVSSTVELSVASGSPSVVIVTRPTTATSTTNRSQPRYPSRRTKVPPRNPFIVINQPRTNRPTRRPPVLRPRTKSPWTRPPRFRRTTRKMTTPQQETDDDISTSTLLSNAVTTPPSGESQSETTMTSEATNHGYFDEGILYNPHHDREFIHPIAPHKLDIDSANNEAYHRLAHMSMVGGILLAVIGSVFLVGGVAMYCWRKNKGIARARHGDIDGRTLSASDAMEDFTWMEAREYRH